MGKKDGKWEERLAVLLEETLENASEHIGRFAKAEIIEALTAAFDQLGVEIDGQDVPAAGCGSEQPTCEDCPCQHVCKYVDEDVVADDEEEEEATEDDGEAPPKEEEEETIRFCEISPKDIDPRVQKALIKAIELLLGDVKPTKPDKKK